MIGRILYFVSRYVSKSRYKEDMAKIYFRLFNRMYELNKMILNIESTNEEIFIEFKDGMKLFGPSDSNSGAEQLLWEPLELKYGYPDKMNHLFNCKGIERFEGFLSLLINQLVLNVSEKEYHLKYGDTVADIGAHVGVFSIKAAREVGREGTVIAIEPEFENLAMLKKNIEINGLQNIIVIPKGVWSWKNNGNLYLTDSRTHSLHTGGGQFVQIELDTLDNILEELGIPNVSFVKMNIEGAEVEALKGMTRILSHGRTIFVIAANHMVENKETSADVIKLLSREGQNIRRTYGRVSRIYAQNK